MKQPIIVLYASIAALLAGALSPQAAGKGKPGGGGGGGTVPGNPAIVYMGEHDSRGGSLKVMDADGANQRVLLQRTKSMGISDPTWHPDGQRIMFTFGPNTQSKGRGVYQINLDGSGLSAIIPAPAYEGYYHAFEQCDVSPLPGSHGKHRIAFRHRWPDNKGIFVIDEDGSGEIVQVAPPRAESPSWSPDGRHLAYGGGVKLEYCHSKTRVVILVDAAENQSRISGREGTKQ